MVASFGGELIGEIWAGINGDASKPSAGCPRRDLESVKRVSSGAAERLFEKPFLPFPSVCWGRVPDPLRLELLPFKLDSAVKFGFKPETLCNACSFSWSKDSSSSNSW